MAKPRFIGDQHVREVYKALVHRKESRAWSSESTEVARETARFIWTRFPNPEQIVCKFDHSNPDLHPDLTILTANSVYPINLFSITGSQKVQQKNLGAKSFLSKYFLSDDLQAQFNHYFNYVYTIFLEELLEAKSIAMPSNIEDLKTVVRGHFPHFDELSSPCRSRFLLSIRDHSFMLLQNHYNTNPDGFMYAFDELLLANQMNVVTRIYKDRVTVEELKPVAGEYKDIVVYKKNRDTIGIQYGSVALTLRFKFESSPLSAIKLAASYEEHSSTAEFLNQTKLVNQRSIAQMEAIWTQTLFSKSSNISNAVGKCHEAFSYYWLLVKNPGIIQNDEQECSSYFHSYLSKIDQTTATAIRQSSEQTAELIMKYIHEKRNSATLEGIQLVADIYTSDRLNTGDVKVSIRHRNGQVDEIYISLKAIRNMVKKITTKNPGMGTLLGATYFDLQEDLRDKVATVQAEFEQGQLSHQDCLEALSQEVGMALSRASQGNLVQGIQNLLGHALTVITAYQQNRTIYVEHSNITSRVIVHRNTPTRIQTTLRWNENEEELSLRIKFSGGHSHGWRVCKIDCVNS
ncbi:hypothetical protein [Cohnella luojiensis]|uniref:Uncharacterized protein n=1 Tax=Cohnella luojiensis TaxID=652876 RepID=A0A4Y8M1B6_9BACL|nr:hypothetical protein [Cohnella luojiensis]TFE25603.1 hypothetical protein E2980_13530 [Cohnella luojiensis]